jgi:hypothetical protein
MIDAAGTFARNLAAMSCLDYHNKVTIFVARAQAVPFELPFNDSSLPPVLLSLIIAFFS